MSKQYPSIFNDVLGPVMRGSSSSHTAASVRIGLILNQLRKPGKTKVDFYFQKGSSIAMTYHTQQSDIGLAAGLLGFEAKDARLLDSLSLLKMDNVDLNFHQVDEKADHPNNYRASLQNEDGSSYSITALSTGGGMIELIEFQGFPISEDGGFHLALIRDPQLPAEDSEYDLPAQSEIIEGIRERLLLARSSDEFSAAEKEKLQRFAAEEIVYLKPVLPVPSQVRPQVPFTSVDELIDFAGKNSYSAWEAAMAYEMARSGMSEQELMEMMDNILTTMESAIQSGLKGTVYSDRILGQQSNKLLDPAFKFVGGDLFRDIIVNTTAVMEVKSSLGTIVATPTAGSCGAVPGTVLSVAKALQAERETVLRSLFVAGLIGIFIAFESTFSAELAGCQAECGSASGMAAGALAYLMCGDLQQTLSSASLALQSVIGLVCDPVAGRVEVPCLGKNILAGHNALACANMALAGFDPVIPLSETIEAMDEAGRMMPAALRCTTDAGLANTETSKRIGETLSEKGCWSCRA